jgi:GMP synthase-like glutamine amidotransferase
VQMQIDSSAMESSLYRQNAQVWRFLFTDSNDGSNGGFIHKSRPYFTAQFHPEFTNGWVYVVVEIMLWLCNEFDDASLLLVSMLTGSILNHCTACQHSKKKKERKLYSKLSKERADEDRSKQMARLHRGMHRVECVTKRWLICNLHFITR